MRSFKHQKSSGSGCNCSFGKLLLLMVFIIAAAYGMVIASMMSTEKGTAVVDHVQLLSSQLRTSPSSSGGGSSGGSASGTSGGDSISDTHSHPVLDPDDFLDMITHVVECKTTHGPVTIDVRAHWGPLGTAQYLSLVDQGFFTDLPFFRVAPRYITQFGAKLRETNTASVKTIRDDPPLWGKRDMDFGYLFFAGSGPHSRHDQMVLALCEQKGCIQTALGKAPWEVPIGTVREEDFPTLKAIMKTGFPYPKLEMSGQHKNAGGPNQGKIRSDSSYLIREYPDMAYWKECKVVRRDVNIHSPIKNKNKVVFLPSSKLPTVGGISPPHTETDRGIFVRFDISLVHDHPEHPTSSSFVVEVKPEWAPLGAQRFLELVESKFFDNCRFFRALKNFMAQFGIANDPQVTAYWRKKTIPDDPVVASNERGHLSFAMAGPNTRSTQFFINFRSNAFLDKQKFAPFGRVVEGLENIDAIYTGYGEGGNGKGTDGKGPNQNMLNNRGETYLQELFPKLTIIRSVTILKDYQPRP